MNVAPENVINQEMTDEEKASEFSEYFEGGVMIQGRTIKQCLEEKLAVIETTEELLEKLELIQKLKCETNTLEIIVNGKSM